MNPSQTLRTSPQLSAKEIAKEAHRLLCIGKNTRNFLESPENGYSVMWAEKSAELALAEGRKEQSCDCGTVADMAPICWICESSQNEFWVKVGMRQLAERLTEHFGSRPSLEPVATIRILADIKAIAKIMELLGTAKAAPKPSSRVGDECRATASVAEKRTPSKGDLPAADILPEQPNRAEVKKKHD